MLMEIMEINIYSYPACMHRLGVPARLEVTCDNNVVMLVHSLCATLTITMHRRCMEKNFMRAYFNYYLVNWVELFRVVL